MTLPPFVDVASLTEEQRITLMGRSVMEKLPDGQADKPIVVGFVVENQEKAERYKRLLKEQFPGIRIIDQKKDCPTPGLITVRIGSPLN